MPPPAGTVEKPWEPGRRGRNWGFVPRSASTEVARTAGAGRASVGTKTSARDVELYD